MTYLFSVVIPTYNRRLKLQRALESLRLQLFKDFEVIIVDDGSTDETSLVPPLYYGYLHINYFYINNSGGPARPRNVGIDLSTGSYICFLDSDDIWLPNKLLELSRCIDLSPSPDIIWHRLRLYSDKPTNILASFRTIGIDPFHKASYSSQSQVLRLLDLGNCIPLSSLVVSRKYISEHSLHFCEEEEFVAWEDFQFIIGCFSSNDVRYEFINKVLGLYEFGSGISSDLHRRKRIVSTIADKYFDQRKSLPSWLALEAIRIQLKENNYQPSLLLSFIVHRILYALKRFAL